MIPPPSAVRVFPVHMTLYAVRSGFRTLINPAAEQA